MKEVVIKGWACSYCGKQFITKQKCREHEELKCMDECSPHIMVLMKKRSVGVDIHTTNNVLYA